MAGESTPLRGVTSDSAASQRKTRLAAIAGVAVVAAVAIGFWATSGGGSNTNVGSAAGSGSSPQAAPLSVTPLPTTEAPVPATMAPVPTTVAPAPVPTTEKPAPTSEKPAPTTEKPAPTTEKPAPTTEKPAPTTEKPAPTTEKPAPTTEKPAPTTEKPAPTTEKPEPTTDKPAETTEKPAPTSVKPEPATDKPVSATEKPEPTTTQPKVTTAAPVAATTVPSVAPAVSSVAPVPVVAPTTTKAPTPISVHDVTCGISNTEAGYIRLPNKKNDNYFYWYYESRASPPTDPLVVWLTGGPGCSSLMAMLSENGPCTVLPNLTTQLNPYSWNSHANVIWLDQPSNVGYSYSTEADDVDKDEDDVGDNFFWFLNGFLDKHPELEGRDLYITGESYAGHYVPAVAHKIWQQTKIIKAAGTPVRINLKGIAIGNGLTNPEIQMQHQLDMVNNTYNVTLMSPEDYAHAQEIIPKCTAIIKDILAGGNFTLTDDKLVECQLVLEPFKKAGRNPYDIRLPCGDVADATQCYDTTYISEYLNSDAVRKYLNVTSPKPWLECDASVGLNFMKSGDVAINYESYVADLLNDGSVRVLLYVGDADTVCNWYGNKAWATALEWTHKAEFNAAEDHAFVTGNGSIQAGVAKAYSNQFTFLRLFNSGHMVPRDQPAVALEMIEKFFRGETY